LYLSSRAVRSLQIVGGGSHETVFAAIRINVAGCYAIARSIEDSAG
jgi:hypothetical protein